MKVIVDDNVSENSLLFKEFLKWAADLEIEFLFVSKHGQERSRDELLHTLLPKYRMLVTLDAELHNKALVEGFHSFTLNAQKKMTESPVLCTPSKKKALIEVCKEEEETSLEAQVLIDRLLDTLSSAHQEKVREKKRRIRRFFEKLTQVEKIFLTVFSEEEAGKVFGGYLLNIQGKKPFKGLMLASEGYLLDPVHQHLLSPIFYALSYVYCLELTRLPIVLQVISSRCGQICKDLQTPKMDEEDPIAKGVNVLIKHLPKLEIKPVLQGPLFQRMQSKLYQMSHGNLQEATILDFAVIARSLF